MFFFVEPAEKERSNLKQFVGESKSAIRDSIPGDKYCFFGPGNLPGEFKLSEPKRRQAGGFMSFW